MPLWSYIFILGKILEDMGRKIPCAGFHNVSSELVQLVDRIPLPSIDAYEEPS